MKEYYQQFFKKYKAYIIVVLAFFIWMLFFDEFHWIRINKEKQKLEYLKREQVELKKKIEEDKQKLREVQSHDPEQLEKFAREQYYMKKDDETIFIMEE